jgi:serine/threonine-protein kinase
LFEALTARKVFEGETVTDILAAIVRVEPRWEWLPEGTPSRIRDLLRRCLQKDERRRLRDVGEARIAIEEASSDPASPPVARPGGSTASFYLAWTLAGASALAAVTLWLRAPPEGLPPPVRRFTVERRGLFDTGVAISSAGTRLVYQDVSNDGSLVFLRELDQLTSTPIPGTEDAGGVFFSRDAEWIGYFDGRSLKKVSLRGGSPTTVTDVHSIGWGTWSEDGTIVYGSYEGGLFRVSSEGGSRRR